ncbi:CG15643, partial [Drosophila busckii]
MWPAALTRLLRRRIIYIILLLLVLILMFGNFFDRQLLGGFSRLHYDDYVVKRTRPLLWQQEQEEQQQLNRTRQLELPCRNSVQGRRLLTDELGFVCLRDQLLPNGCCNPELTDGISYSCQSCNPATHCCAIYEYCVSCCLQPDKRALLEKVLQSSPIQKYVYASVEDQFELCLVKCRTNSHSVEHENKYRNEAAKYCYGPTEAHESQREVAPR